MSHIEKLNWRYATKEFDNTKKLSDDQLNTVLEGLRLSASSFGLQPWKFVVVNNKELREKLVDVSWNQKQVVDASHLIVLCRPTEFGDKDVDKFIADTAKTRGQDLAELEGYSNMMKGFLSRMEKPALNQWMKDQVYLALGSMMVTCAELEIDACPMEGFSAPDYDKILELDKHGLTSVLVCPVGFRARTDKYASLAKVRYSKEEVVLIIN